MASLGSFSVAAAEADPDNEPDTFEFEGEAFELSTKFGMVPIGRWLEETEDATPGQRVVVAMRLLRAVIADKDWDRFERLAALKRADYNDLIPIVYAALGVKTGRPTEQPSDSSDGLSADGATSKEPSSSEESSTPHPEGLLADPRMAGMQTVDEFLDEFEARHADANA